MARAVFGGGCFWCTEAVFKMLKGVEHVAPGYAGGTTANPTYAEVCSGQTGHAEVIEIQYNPNQVAFTDLLTVFFATHNPTTKNRQGNDVGSQYRSVIFYTDNDQKHQAERCIAELNNSNEKGAPIVTTVEPLTTFYPAENYHRDYFSNHQDQPYCQVVINPKLDKVKQKFAALLK